MTDKSKLTLDDLLKQAVIPFPIQQFISDDTKKVIDDLLTNLSSLSENFKDIKDSGGKLDVMKEVILSKEDAAVESLYFSAIIRSGYADVHIPLILLSRCLLWNRFISAAQYLKLLKTVECFIYRTHLIAGYRSNYCKKDFYQCAASLVTGVDHYCTVFPVDELRELQLLNRDIDVCIDFLYVAAPSPSKIEELIKAPKNWYNTKWEALKYTLFEYEKWLIEQKQPGYPVAVEWRELDDELTREHILPQILTDYWQEKWSKEDYAVWVNDIGNILLTFDNSVYSNHPYPRKCRGEDENGNKVTDRYYADSELKQEREMVKYKEWTVNEVKQRHSELVEFILKRWSFD